MALAELVTAVIAGIALGQLVVLMAPRGGQGRALRRKDEPEAAARTTTEVTLAKIGLDAWKLAQAVRRAQDQMDDRAARRLGSRLKWFEKKLDEGLLTEGIRLHVPTGQAYDEGMPLTISNADEHDTELELVITDTVEPIISGQGGRILHTGLVKVGRNTE